MKKFTLLLAILLCFQMTADAATSKWGKILQIMTEDVTETNTNSTATTLKKVSDLVNSVESGTNTSATNLTTLQTAIKNNDMATVAKLLSNGTDVNKTVNNTSSLHLAVLNDNADMIKTLIKAGADINTISATTGDSEVSLAAGLGKTNALSALINCGAKIDTTNKKGWTPLHNAVSTNQIESVKILINSGANVNAKSNNGVTPLGLATILKRTEIKNLLVKAGATYNF